MRSFYWGKESILVLGDSHASVFDSWRFRTHFPRTKFKLCIVGGATVSGFQNPNSQTQALLKFRDALKVANPTIVITLLGEVDTGFVIWYRAEKWSQPVDEMLQVALDNYEKLLFESASTADLIAISAPLPTIRDGQQWGEIANLRKSVTASQHMRTRLTLDFNHAVADRVMRMKQTYISLDRMSIGDDGLVADWLINADPSDHHYSKPQYAKLLIPILVDAVRKIRAQSRP